MGTKNHVGKGTSSLAQAIQANRQRWKYRRVLNRLRLVRWEYTNSAILTPKYNRVVGKCYDRAYPHSER